ncbi:hypothetical protein E4U55_003379 [Claviceps digitariae]|nr:hypothetical protein E4U55_003379 [Claviceps digitariae]
MSQSGGGICLRIPPHFGGYCYADPWDDGFQHGLGGDPPPNLNIIDDGDREDS